MSIVSQSFYLAFGGNLLFAWGLMPSRNSRPSSPKRGAIPVARTGLFLAACAMAALAHSLVFRYILEPLGLDSLVPFVFTLALFGAYRAIAYVFRAIEGFAENDNIRPIPASLALYACVLAVNAQGGSVLGIMVSGAAAAFGFLLSSAFLDDIMEQHGLEPAPVSFRGLPTRFLSAGLIALAFSGVDMAFFGRILSR